MDEFEIRRIIYDDIKEICHLSQMQLLATSSYQKNYFQLQIDDTVNGLINFFLMSSDNIGRTCYSSQPADQQLTMAQQPGQPQPQSREITQEELAQSNGSEGRPAYVAVNQTVYDMTQIIQWAGGTHFGQYAGKDLSNEFAICHKGAIDILNKLPKVGILKQ
jgi:predicted heme/steroid binding protein